MIIWDTHAKRGGDDDSGGIMIAVKGNNETNTTWKSISQALWVQIDNQKIIIKVEVTYAPQENVTPARELKKMYESITKEIQEAREHKQQVIAIGHFNVEVGAARVTKKL